MFSSVRSFAGRKSMQRGFTLIEVGIVILIAAGILFAVIRLSAGKGDETRSQSEATALSQIMQNVSKAVTAGAKVTTTAEAISAGVFPKDWVNGTAVTNGFRGTVDLTAPDANTRQISLTNITRAACPILLPMIAANPTVSKVEGAPGTTTYTVIKSSTTAAVTIAGLSTACNADLNNIRFNFILQ